MNLTDFIRESNAIEGITREPMEAELAAAKSFLTLNRIEIVDLCNLVSVFQPDAVIRDKVGLDVRVGNHIAPRGGPGINPRLRVVLDEMRWRNAFETHVAYETLHPFTDGNGRSGRMLWAWQMDDAAFHLGFLHSFYYQALGASRTPA